MDIQLEYVELIAALYMVTIGALMSTRNLRSLLLLRLVPLILGIALMFDAASRMGYIIQLP